MIFWIPKTPWGTSDKNLKMPWLRSPVNDLLNKVKTISLIQCLKSYKVFKQRKTTLDQYWNRLSTQYIRQENLFKIFIRYEMCNDSYPQSKEKKKKKVFFQHWKSLENSVINPHFKSNCVSLEYFSFSPSTVSYSSFKITHW